MAIIFVFILMLIIFKYLKDKQVHEDGYKIVKNLLNDEEMRKINLLWDNKNYKELKHFFMQNNKLKNILNNDYVLIDYSYFIENSAIHTYHRDYTSSQKYNNLDFPSYTLILYLNNSDIGLNLIPGSHVDENWFYIIDKSKKLKFNKGDAIIFNADILHAGSALSQDIKRRCVQFKIIHKNDIYKMPWLLNFHVLINRPNKKINLFKKIEASSTRQFPIIMDLTNKIIKTSFNEDKSFLQKIFSKFLFSNEDFYKPINI